MNVINEITKSSSNTFTSEIEDCETKQIKSLTLSILGSENNLDRILDQKKFSKKDLNNFINLVSRKYQSQFKEIISPIVKRLTPDQYLGLNSDNIRISVQAKHTWPLESENYERKTFFDSNGAMLESKDEFNFSFPTRPHQDLSNNAFRSSHVLIFYFQITDIDSETSDLEVANFEAKKGLYEYSNKWGYYNQLTDAVSSRLNWHKPKELNSNSVLIMDSLTPHRSTLTSNKVRLAVNVKIQPEKLNYLFNKQENSEILKVQNQSDKIRLNLIKELLLNKAKTDVQLNYELGLVNFLLNNPLEMENNFNNLCLFTLNEEERNKMIAAGFLRKTLNFITNEDVKDVFKSKSYNKLSCVDTIYNTFN